MRLRIIFLFDAGISHSGHQLHLYSPPHLLTTPWSYPLGFYCFHVFCVYFPTETSRCTATRRWFPGWFHPPPRGGWYWHCHSGFGLVGLLWLWTILWSESFELNCCVHDGAILLGSTGEDVLSGLFDAIGASWSMGCRFLVELEWYRHLCLKYSSSLDVRKVHFLHWNLFSLGVVCVFAIMTSDSLMGKVVGVLPIY